MGLSAGTELVIGARAVVYTYGFDGEIADLKFYNYAFSEAEAVAYHNQWADDVKYRDVLALDHGAGDTI